MWAPSTSAVVEHLVDAGLLDVEDLAAEGEDGLDAAVAAVLGRAACGVALHEEELALGGVAAGAGGQLAGHAEALERALLAGGLAGLAGGLAGLAGEDGLLDDGAGDGGVLGEEVRELGRDDALHQAGDVGAELGLGLSLELRLRDLDRDDGGEALADVVAGEDGVGLLAELVVGDVLVDGGGEGRAEAGQVGAARPGR